VARLFLARGCEVLGVEPDSRMAGVARSHGIPVEVATFELWNPAHRMFDLVVCGQAWHWIDPSLGAQRAAFVLKPGGRLAIFWNRGGHDAPTQAALNEVYVRFAPALIGKESVPLANQPSERSDDIAAIAATRLYEPCRLRTYPWTHQYSREEWLDQLGTHSDHIALEPEQRAQLYHAVGAAIDRLGGSIRLDYVTELISAQRLA